MNQEADVVKFRLMKKILVLCTGNSCRSQIAEAYLTSFSKKMNKNIEVVSAGVETHGLNPNAVKIMAEDGIDISGNQSENVEQYLSTGVSHVITVCDNAKESCPVFPEKINLIHKSFPDPAPAKGTEEEVMAIFRGVREEIKDYCKAYIEKM